MAPGATFAPYPVSSPQLALTGPQIPTSVAVVTTTEKVPVLRGESKRTKVYEDGKLVRIIITDPMGRVWTGSGV